MDMEIKIQCLKYKIIQRIAPMIFSVLLDGE